MDEKTAVEAMARGLCAHDRYEWVDSFGDEWRAKAQAALDALKANGFAVVPVEPTQEMITEGMNEMYDPCGLVRAYRAMIAAAQGGE